MLEDTRSELFVALRRIKAFYGLDDRARMTVAMKADAVNIRPALKFDSFSNSIVGFYDSAKDSIACELSKIRTIKDFEIFFRHQGETFYKKLDKTIKRKSYAFMIVPLDYDSMVSRSDCCHHVLAIGGDCQDIKVHEDFAAQIQTILDVFNDLNIQLQVFISDSERMQTGVFRDFFPNMLFLPDVVHIHKCGIYSLTQNAKFRSIGLVKIDLSTIHERSTCSPSRLDKMNPKTLLIFCRDMVAYSETGQDALAALGIAQIMFIDIFILPALNFRTVKGLVQIQLKVVRILFVLEHFSKRNTVQENLTKDPCR